LRPGSGFSEGTATRTGTVPRWHCFRFHLLSLPYPVAGPSKHKRPGNMIAPGRTDAGQPQDMALPDASRRQLTLLTGLAAAEPWACHNERGRTIRVAHLAVL
jgi:hypothetical protein